MGKSVLDEVKRIFEERRVPEYLNKTHVALIPKIQGPETLGNYRPISLCNTVYKIVTKILVARLRPFLDTVVSLLQAAFVPGRRAIDNAIIAQEVIHFISKKRGNEGYMVLKIDLEKAFMLYRVNLPMNLIDIIMSCLNGLYLNFGQWGCSRPNIPLKRDKARGSTIPISFHSLYGVPWSSS